MFTSHQVAEPTLAQALEYYRQGKRTDARRLCEEVLAVQPGHGGARQLLSITQLEMGEVQSAIDNLEQVLESQPHNAGALAALGQAKASAGRTGEACRILARAIEIEPTQTESYLMLSQLLIRTGDEARAIQLLRDGLDVAPNHLGLLNNLGSLLADSGDTVAGQALLERALAQDEGVSTTHYNLAKVLKAAGNLEAAVRHFQRATEIQPNLLGAWHNLGNTQIDLGLTEDAFASFQMEASIRRRPGGPLSPPGNFKNTTRAKLRHDIDQLTYLIGQGRLPAKAQYIVAAYEAALAVLPETAKSSDVVPLPPELQTRLAPTYNRRMHWRDTPALEGGALDMSLDWAAVEAEYRRNGPGYAIVDGFLTKTALESIRQFCLESTIWFKFNYSNDYLGAFMDDGFSCPLLLQIAEDLRRAMPGILGRHPLRKTWAFKCGVDRYGVPIHADFAAVNVNFWITPDDANLEPEGSGLVVWDQEAPIDWNFDDYNRDEARMRGFLRDSGAKAINVAHRQNRMIIFNSDLFHETGALKFREGYENRRINITMLYGKREDA